MILRRLPDSRYSEVLPEWTDKVAILLGGGPSLTLRDIELVQWARDANSARVIAINDTYLIAPWSDVCYFADAKWFGWHSQGIAKDCLRLTAPEVKARFAAFSGEKCSIQNSMQYITDENVHILRNATFPNHANGLSRDPQKIVTGWNSGFQALNLAILAGVRTVLLLGYDAREPNGSSHWHGGHPSQTPIAAYAEYRKAMSQAEHAINEAGVHVINCSPGSAIDSWEKMDLCEALK